MERLKMIYRHYKGGLYFVVGYVTRFTSYNSKSIEDKVVAKHVDDLRKIKIFSVKDVNSHGEYFAFDDDSLNGIYVLYKSLNDDYWLREREDFFGLVEKDI